MQNVTKIQSSRCHYIISRTVNRPDKRSEYYILSCQCFSLLVYMVCVFQLYIKSQSAILKMMKSKKFTTQTCSEFNVDKIPIANCCLTVLYKSFYPYILTTTTSP